MLTISDPSTPLPISFLTGFFRAAWATNPGCHPRALLFGPWSQRQPDVAEAELLRGMLSCKPNGNEERPKAMSALRDKQGQLTQPER